LVALAADDLAGIARAAAGLRARVVGQALPPEVAAEIAPACAALGDGPVAVRSSATLEDSAEASFAGLQDTYLAVRGPARCSTGCAPAGPACTTTSRSPTGAARAPVKTA